MDPRERIRTIILIEKMKDNPEYAEKIIVKDTSHFKKTSKDK